MTIVALVFGLLPLLIAAVTPMMSIFMLVASVIGLVVNMMSLTKRRMKSKVDNVAMALSSVAVLGILAIAVANA